jgi:hypothetical protein
MCCGTLGDHILLTILWKSGATVLHWNSPCVRAGNTLVLFGNLGNLNFLFMVIWPSILGLVAVLYIMVGAPGRGDFTSHDNQEVKSMI